MDEKIKTLLDTMLAERFEIAFADMREAQPEMKRQTEQAIKLSEKIMTGISDSGIKETLERFHAIQMDLDGRYQRHLYIQGAKDCVAILRELGVIK